jgi:hypothetical protein
MLLKRIEYYTRFTREASMAQRLLSSKADNLAGSCCHFLNFLSK